MPREVVNVRAPQLTPELELPSLHFDSSAFPSTLKQQLQRPSVSCFSLN